VSANLGDGRGVTVPQPLINWKVLTEDSSSAGSMAYNPYNQASAPYNFYLPPGTIDFEYQPWASMQPMVVRQLGVALQGPATSGSTIPFTIYLWHWSEERWHQLPDARWGLTAVPEAAPFLGPANAVRLRLQNVTSSSFEIRSIYPSYNGDLD
jgi:hypothetical protein